MARCPTCHRRSGDGRRSYRAQLREVQAQLGSAQRARPHPLVVCLDGRDAAGKTGTARRLVRDMEAGSFQVFHSSRHNVFDHAAISAHLPTLTVFDRSWWAAPIAAAAEGLEGLTTAAGDAARAERLFRPRATLLKFWCEIPKDEQYRRLKKREADGGRKYRLSDADWRALDLYDEYTDAFEAIRDDTWTVVEFSDKPRARLLVLRLALEALRSTRPGPSPVRVDAPPESREVPDGRPAP